MDQVLFTIGGTAFDIATLTVIGVALVLVVLVAMFIVMVRGNGDKVEQAANAASESLRTNFLQQVAERDRRIQTLDSQLDQQRRENSTLQSESAALRAQMNEQAKQAEENFARFQRARQQMSDEFKAIAGEVLKSHGETFSKQNREQVDTLLRPLNEKIGEFQKMLTNDHAVMNERIRALSEESMRMAAEANNLTRALKGNTQTQGAWGEMILSTILERSGLREGEHFVTQQTHVGDDGARLRTDVEVMMPNGDSIVIDSKVSLTAFEALTNAEDDEARSQNLAAHVTSVRAHIKTLSGKEYQRHARSGMDFVLMFVPIEAAFSTAITHDPLIIDYATSQGVFINTPTTLMSVLRTVRNVWDIEKRHQNADEIAERAGALYDKVVGFVGTMDKLGTHISRAQQSFDDAKSQLSSGRGNVLRQVDMLKELGAKTSKKMPDGWDSSGPIDEKARLELEQEDIE